MWTVLCGWLLAMSLVSGSRPRLESTCDTLANKIHLTKEEFNKAKELMRTCEEDVELMKCEGACVSTTMPSAMERSEYILSIFGIFVNLLIIECIKFSGYKQMLSSIEG